MAYTKIPVDETILANPANEETNALPYWIEACAYLFNLIIGDPDLSRLPIGDQLHALLSFWRTKRLSADRADLEDAALDLSYFGPVGKAVWYVTDEKDPQFKGVDAVCNRSSICGWQSLSLLYRRDTCGEWLQGGIRTGGWQTEQ